MFQFHVHVYTEIFLVDKFSLVCTREIKTTRYTQLLQIVKSKTFVKQAFTGVYTYQPAVYTAQSFQQGREGSAII